jgi:hypothetical protein
MKKTLLATALVGAFFLAPARGATITLVAPATVAGPFDVVVNATDVFAAPHDTDFLLAYGFDISYDNSVLAYLGETPGALFTDLSGNPGIGAQVAGVAAAILLGPGDFTEPLTLATLHFGLVGTGTTSISISGDIANPDQGLVYLGGSDPISARTSLDASATPEPGAMLLAGAGLGALLLKKRLAARG